MALFNGYSQLKDRQMINEAVCPLCNHLVAIASNYPHNHRCANAHRLYSQWLTPESGHPVYAHPDDPTESPTDMDNPNSGDAIDLTADHMVDLQVGWTSEPEEVEVEVESPPDVPNSTTETFGGGGDFGGGGGGSDF